MRWLIPLLALAAAAAGYCAAVQLRVRIDRKGPPRLARPPAIEKLLRVLDENPSARIELTERDRAHVWGQAMSLVFENADHSWATFEDVDAQGIRQFFNEHGTTAPAAWALLQWVRRPASHKSRVKRRTVFRQHFPRSWVVAAWAAQGKR